MKKISILLTVLLVAGLLYACSDNAVSAGREEVYAKAFAAAERLNEHSNFGEYELLQESSQEGLAGYTRGQPENFLINSLDGDFMLHGVYSPYPNNSNTRRLTQLVIYSSNYHVYGVTVGDTIAEAQEKLIAAGCDDIRSYEDGLSVSADNIYINFNIDKNIYEIVVTAYDPFTPDIDGAY